MTKILKSLAIIVAVVAVAGGVTYAASWNSIKTSNNSTFAAGTVELAIDKGAGFGQGSSQLFTETNLAPGVETSEKTLYFRNVGSIDGKVKLNLSYVNQDKTNPAPATDMSANMFARNLQLIKGVTQNVDVTLYWTTQIVKTYAGADYATQQVAALADMAFILQAPVMLQPCMA